MKRIVARATTMQGLVKYHGMRDWRLRIPYHDSVSVNTTTLVSETVVTEAQRSEIVVDGKRNQDAEKRVVPLLARLTGKRFEELKLKVESENRPPLDAKGLGFSSSGGAALTVALERALNGGKADATELSRIARLFAASAARSVAGGFSRLYAGKGDEDTFAEKFADAKDLDLRMVIVPLPSTVRTETAHREVESSPFFKARIESALKRCDEMEKAIRGGDLKRLGVLAEQDTLELHSITMTGENRMIILSADSINVITKVRELRDNSVEAYFSMQTGPSVFINTTEEDQGKVRRAISKLGYKTILSSVGPGARVTSA